VSSSEGTLDAAAGQDVTSLASGDEVLTHPVPLRHQGAWAEWLVAPAALVAPRPAAVPWETAAAFPVPALTADQALSEAVSFPAGVWVLVHGAGGVTGGLIVQLAVARGATVVATAGPSSESRVRDYGARVVFDYHDRDWPARVRAACPGGRGVGAAVNAARGGAASALQAVADDGRLATITGDPPTAERGVTVADVYVEADGARLAALAEALKDGLLSLNVGATFALADAATALQGAVTGRAAGATVLTLDRSPEPEHIASVVNEGWSLDGAPWLPVANRSQVVSGQKREYKRNRCSGLRPVAVLSGS
jgi:NADPH:quinone reductase-like Zn-dependent oxidoreductase